jgi:hypothetical protein
MLNQQHWNDDTQLDLETKKYLQHKFRQIGVDCDIYDSVCDDKGIDLILNNHIYVDIKRRRFPVERYNDILIEIYANWESKTPGWAVDDTRVTHVYLYVFDNKIIMFNRELIHAIGVSQLKNIGSDGKPIMNHNRFRRCFQGDYSTINYHHPLTKIIDQRISINQLISTN